MTSSIEVMDLCAVSYLAEMLLEPMNIVCRLLLVKKKNEGVEQGDGGLDTIDDELSKCALQPHQAFVAGARVHDELADQAVIIRRDGVAGICARIDPDTEAARRVEMGDGAGRWPEGMRVLGIDTAFDGVAVEAHILLTERQRRARRDPDLLDDEVEPGNHLGDGVLDLKPRVHLDEVELASFVEELDRADAAVVELAHRPSHRLADVDGIALAVGQNLHFDVTGVG